MDIQKTQIIETIIVVFIYVITFFITKTAISKVLKNTQLQRARRKIVIKAVHLFTTFATLILIAAIWGVQQNEIALFASTILTALGIAFLRNGHYFLILLQVSYYFLTIHSKLAIK